MAAIIQRDFELPTLRISWVPRRQSAMVKFELVRGGGEKIYEILLPASKFGMGDDLSYDTLWENEFVFPKNELDELLEAISELTNSSSPLWLLIPRNSIPAAIFPWDRMISKRIDAPVFRIPNFLADPFIRKSRPVIAICASAPVAKSEGLLISALNDLLDEISAGVQPGRVHIFMDEHSRTEFSDTIYKWNDRFKIVVHVPDTDIYGTEVSVESQVRAVAEGLTNPWMRWMADELSERQVDMVHFLCPGYSNSVNGSLALAVNPIRNDDKRWARFVGAGELSVLLNVVGANAVGFTPISDDVWTIGLRLLAFQVAWKRPGPIFVSDAIAPNRALSHLFAFLFGGVWNWDVLKSSFGFYCHPTLLETVVDPNHFEWAEFNVNLANEMIELTSGLLPLDAGIMNFTLRMGDQVFKAREDATNAEGDPEHALVRKQLRSAQSQLTRMGGHSKQMKLQREGAANALEFIDSLIERKVP